MSRADTRARLYAITRPPVHRHQIADAEHFQSLEWLVPPPPRHVWTDRYWAVRFYLSTLWRAIKGENPYDWS